MSRDSLFDDFEMRRDATPEPTAPPVSSEAESIALLALASINGLGYRGLYRLSSTHGSLSAIVSLCSAEEIARALAVADVKSSRRIGEVVAHEWSSLFESAKQEYEQLGAMGVRVLHHFDSDFPDSLRNIPQRPRWLFVEGDIRPLHRPLAALVGTRDPTSAGRFLARFCCYLLAHSPYGTVSGLATGIDQEVHACSLEIGLPTVAILGGGIRSQFSPPAVGFRDRIIKGGGCLVSEYFPWEEPAGERFVWRNRLQSGLATVVVPAEWRIRSGTAHTVRHALDQRRPVVGLQLPVAPTPENQYLRDNNMSVFSIPGQADQLRQYILGLASRSDGVQ